MIDGDGHPAAGDARACGWRRAWLACGLLILFAASDLDAEEATAPPEAPGSAGLQPIGPGEFPGVGVTLAQSGRYGLALVTRVATH